MLPAWTKSHPGQYVVKKGEAVSFFPTYGKASQYAFETYGLEPFLVTRVPSEAEELATTARQIESRSVLRRKAEQGHIDVAALAEENELLRSLLERCLPMVEIEAHKYRLEVLREIQLMHEIVGRADADPQTPIGDEYGEECERLASEIPAALRKCVIRRVSAKIRTDHDETFRKLADKAEAALARLPEWKRKWAESAFRQSSKNIKEFYAEDRLFNQPEDGGSQWQ